MLRIIRDLLIRRRARQDAAQGIDSREDHIVAALGPRPQFDPSRDFLHARVARDLGNRVQIGELRDDLRGVEDEMSHHPPSGWLLVALVLLFCVETLGSVLVMRAMGFENPERMILGMMLAAIIFFLTYLAAQLSGPAPARDGGPRGRGTALAVVEATKTVEA